MASCAAATRSARQLHGLALEAEPFFVCPHFPNLGITLHRGDRNKARVGRHDHTVCFQRAIVYRTQGAFSLSLQANVTRYLPLQEQIMSQSIT